MKRLRMDCQSMCEEIQFRYAMPGQSAKGRYRLLHAKRVQITGNAQSAKLHMPWPWHICGCEEELKLNDIFQIIRAAAAEVRAVKVERPRPSNASRTGPSQEHEHAKLSQPAATWEKGGFATSMLNISS
eukprot:3908062-Amphidinium_carterae.1